MLDELIAATEALPHSPALAHPLSWATSMPPPPGAWCPRLPRRALVDRAARAEGLAVHDVLSADAPGG